MKRLKDRYFKAILHYTDKQTQVIWCYNYRFYPGEETVVLYDENEKKIFTINMKPKTFSHLDICLEDHKNLDMHLTIARKAD